MSIQYTYLTIGVKMNLCLSLALLYMLQPNQHMQRLDYSPSTMYQDVLQGLFSAYRFQRTRSRKPIMSLYSTVGQGSPMLAGNKPNSVFMDAENPLQRLISSSCFPWYDRCWLVLVAPVRLCATHLQRIISRHILSRASLSHINALLMTVWLFTRNRGGFFFSSMLSNAANVFEARL